MRGPCTWRLDGAAGALACGRLDSCRHRGAGPLGTGWALRSVQSSCFENASPSAMRVEVCSV